MYLRVGCIEEEDVIVESIHNGVLGFPFEYCRSIGVSSVVASIQLRVSSQSIQSGLHLRAFSQGCISEHSVRVASQSIQLKAASQSILI